MRELSIINCKVSALSALSNVMQFFISLEKLKIFSCEELICLPNSIIQHWCLSLRILDISENKVSVWKGRAGGSYFLHFTSLHSLMLGKCMSLVKCQSGWVASPRSSHWISLLAISWLGCGNLKYWTKFQLNCVNILKRNTRRKHVKTEKMALVPVPDETQ